MKKKTVLYRLRDKKEDEDGESSYPVLCALYNWDGKNLVRRRERRHYCGREPTGGGSEPEKNQPKRRNGFELPTPSYPESVSGTSERDPLESVGIPKFMVWWLKVRLDIKTGRIIERL